MDVTKGEQMKRRSITAGLFTFVIALIVTTIVAVIYIRSASDARRARAGFMVNSTAERIHAEIQRREYITRMLEIEVSSNKGEITSENFQITAEEVFNDFLDIVDISLAPAGVVKYIYPLENGIATRTDLFEDGAQGVYSDYSKMSGVPIIMVPVTLSSGEYGIIIRRPIYTSEDKTESSFWGFASVTLNQSAFLNSVDLKKLADAGYEYRLSAKNPITGDEYLVMEHSEKAFVSPEAAMISTVGGGIWTLEVEPMGNWMDPKEVFVSLLLAVVISSLSALAMSAYVSMRANAKELEVLSYRDALTNLNNPRRYQEHMEELSKKKLPYGLIFMDLNDFKQVNDTYGHDAGDALLNIVAKRLQNSIREKDMAFRIGGDEFVVVIHGTHDKKFFEGVIARMRQNVAREVVLPNVTLQVSISAGFARCPEDGTKFEDVVKKADDAMYYNKRMMKAKRAAARGEKGSTSR